MKKGIIFTAIFFAGLSLLTAHPGRTDSNGGHNGPNGYHTHDGQGNEIYARSAPASPTEEMVSIVPNDRRAGAEKLYHKESCDTISILATEEISKVEAEKLGYKPCDICKPNS